MEQIWTSMGALTLFAFLGREGANVNQTPGAQDKAKTL